MRDDDEPIEWNVVFWIVAALLAIVAVAFWLFA